MNLKHLTVVAIRVAAVFWLLSTILGLFSTLAMVIPQFSGLGFSLNDGFGYLLTPIMVMVVQCAVALFLFLFAVSLANFVCSDIPSAENIPQEKIAIGAGDIYHVASFILGIYTLVQAISPAVQGIVDLVATVENMAMNNYSTATNLATAAIFLVIGIGLTIGAKGISRFMVSLGHDSDDIPAQQFSMRLILVIVIGIGVVLGIIRLLVNT